MFNFFFLNFGLTRPYRPIQADTDRVGLILATLAPISAVSACVGPIQESQRGTTRHGRAVCGVPLASPRPAASDAGALAWEPRPCIPSYLRRPWMSWMASCNLQVFRCYSYLSIMVLLLSLQAILWAIINSCRLHPLYIYIYILWFCYVLEKILLKTICQQETLP